MAKFGEGDPRWKVAQREDGRNVNGWHWEMANYLPQFKDRLTEVMVDRVIHEGEGITLTLKTVENCEGEMSLNQRKGKRFLVYDIENIKVAYEIVGPAGKAKGKFVVEEIDSVEGVNGKFEVSVKYDSDKADIASLNEVARNPGRDCFRKVLADAVREIETAATNSAAAAAALPSDSSPAPPSAPTSSSSAPPPAAVSVPPAAAPATAASSTSSSQHAPVKCDSLLNLKISETFEARPEDIYLCFVDPQRASAFTGARAVVSDVAGTPFSLFDGSISGEMVEIVKGEKIVQTWRLSGWNEGVKSTVTIEIKGTSDGTKLTLTQTGIPARDRHGNDAQDTVVEDGWKRNIFRRIKQVFGFGAPSIE